VSLYNYAFYLDFQTDGYTKTGCINLLCAGFVQTSKKFALGATVEPVSSSSSTQYHITVSIFLVRFSSLYMINILHNFTKL